MRRLLLAIAVLLALPASAGAAVIQDFSGFTSGTNGIALGPDGNFWVAETGSNTVARMSPAGTILGRVTVGPGPTSVAAGPGGSVWVSVTGADRLARIDAATGAVTPYSTAAASDCGPVAIADGRNGRMYFSLPDDGSCAGLSRVGWIENGVITTVPSGTVFDLAVAGGKVFAAEFDADRVRRYSPSLVNEGSVPVSGSPDGIAVAQGYVWVTQYSGGGVARFPATQIGGGAQAIGGNVSQPFGIVAGADGHVYVTGSASGTLMRIAPDGTSRSFTTGGKPWDIVNGADGDLYFTDSDSGRVRRFVSSPPRVSAPASAATALTSANVSATVDARGNPTTVTFEYGPTPALGSAVTVPATGVGPFPVGATLTGLAPGTTYHLRVRAINEEGEGAPSETITFATPAPPPPPPPTLAARANFSWGFLRSRTVLTRVRVTDLSGGETIRITCATKAKGCPFKRKTYRNVKAGTRSLTKLFGKRRKLSRGAKIVVRITKPGAIGSTTTVTIGKRKKDPRIVRRPLQP
mgnify:CR=1 FL=1